ncbi:MAG: glycosyltransferase [Chitinophagaceae bacterium]|nr:glycosyltransferase [Chitinophagaceae bacterium]
MIKKVLYISYDGMTDPLGQSQVIPYLKGLSKMGYRFCLVSAEKKVKFIQKGAAIQKELSENNIEWHPVHYSNNLPGISAFLTYNRLLKKAWQLQREEAFHIVHCRSYIPSLIGLQMKRKHGVKFIFDMRGFWADERVEGGIWNLSNPLYKKAYHFFKKKEKEFLQESDAIVSLTTSGSNEIIARRDLQSISKKINVIPCCADQDLFSQDHLDAKKQQQWSAQSGIKENSYVLCYSGSMGTWYMLEEMLHFFQCLLNHRPAAIFLIITPDEPAPIYEAALKYGIDKSKLIIISAQRAEMPYLISLCNASVFLIRNTYSKKASSPTKLGEIMSMGLPVVCNSGIGDVDEIVRTMNAGIVIDVLDTEHFDVAARQLLNTAFSKTDITAAANTYFSLKKGVDSYRKIYETL